jgi:hypothetical protein
MVHALRVRAGHVGAGHIENRGRLLTVLEGLLALVLLCALVAGAAAAVTLIAVRLVKALVL